MYEKVIWKIFSYRRRFFLNSGGYITNTAYTEETRDLQHMKARIRADIETVNARHAFL